MAQGKRSYRPPLSYLAAAAPRTKKVVQSPSVIPPHGFIQSSASPVALRINYKDDGNDFTLVENKRAKRRGQANKTNATAAPIVLRLKLPPRRKVAPLPPPTAGQYSPLGNIAPITKETRTTTTTTTTTTTQNQQQRATPTKTTTTTAESHLEMPPPSKGNKAFPSCGYPPSPSYPYCKDYPCYYYHHQHQYGNGYAAMAYDEYHYHHGYCSWVAREGPRTFVNVVGRPSVDITLIQHSNDVVAEEEKTVENETLPVDESSLFSDEEIESELESLCNKNDQKEADEHVVKVPKDEEDEFWTKLSFGASDSDPTWETALLGPIPWTPMPTLLVAEEEEDDDADVVTVDPTYWDDGMSAAESLVQMILPITDYDY